uniref:Chitin-binding type-2 domain-containing protein n=1 Tax=Anopheles funestus TaxID=62324 RepID=A0A4Y0BH01_ANOFN
MFYRQLYQSIGSVLVVLVTVMVESAIIPCPTPRCVTYEDINRHWPDPAPTHFQQCRPNPNGTWYLQQMPCSPGLLFSYSRQVCVLPAYWSDCAVQTPDALNCPEPSCITYAEINTRWVHQSETDKFYQCRPVNGTWSPQVMPCAPSTLFSFKQQTCVHQFMWKSSC